MNKDEKIIEEKLSGFKDIYPDEHSEVLSAMEQQAVAFGKHLSKNCVMDNTGRVWNTKANLTSIEEQYKLFNQQN